MDSGRCRGQGQSNSGGYLVSDQGQHTAHLQVWQPSKHFHQSMSRLRVMTEIYKAMLLTIVEIPKALASTTGHMALNTNNSFQDYQQQFHEVLSWNWINLNCFTIALDKSVLALAEESVPKETLKLSELRLVTTRDLRMFYSSTGRLDMDQWSLPMIKQR
ncbi:hypothetical protein TURU_043982 [Turdus rufiventris]|nr:hypothetical protein TURU_043982 [Turdus rufiventris]